MKKIVCCLLMAPVLAHTAYAQWTQQNTGVRNHLRDVAFYNATTGYAVGDGGVILKTINGGDKWTAVTSPDKSDIVSVTVVSSDDVMVTTSSIYANAAVYETKDGGKSWMKVLSDNNSFYATVAPGKALYSISSSIYRSDNWGKDWKAQQPLSNTSIYTQLHFPTGNTGIVAGNVSGVLTYSASFWRTINGVDWYNGDNFSFPNANAFSAFDALGKDTVMMFTNFYNRFMPGDSSQLLMMYNFNLQTEFKRTTWHFDHQVMIPSFPGRIADCKFFNACSGYAMSEQGTVFSVSDGKKVIKEYSGKTPLHALYMIDKNTGFVVGDNGLILKRSTAPVTMPAAAQIPVLAYPNPAADKVNLSLTLPEAARIRVQVTNAAGNIMLVQGARTFEKGKQTIVVPVASLHRGNYYIHLINDKEEIIGTSRVMVAH